VSIHLSGVLRDVVAAAGRSRDGYATLVHPPVPYGLAVCYADAGPPEVCRLCLRMAAGNVTLACPRAAAAAMMYSNCLLRYGDPSGAGALASPDTEQRFSFKLGHKIYPPNAFICMGGWVRDGRIHSIFIGVTSSLLMY
jgi:hypothetical protein